MSKTILNKCPNCGTWCQAEKKGFFGRWSRGWDNAIDSGVETGEKLGGIPGAIIGGGLSSPWGMTFGGGLEAITGDKFQFVCPSCGAK